MNEIVPRDWFSAKLKDISVLTKGLTYASVDYSDEQNGLAFLTLKSISKDGGYSPVGLKFYKGEFREHHTLKIGDVLFANTDLTRNGDVVGSPLFFDGFGMDRTTLYSMDLSKLAVNPQKVHSKFLYYLLTTYHVKRYMVNSSAGSTVLHLDTKRVKELELNFPPLPEQKKIASILTSVDQVIEKTQKQIEKLQDLKKAMINELLTKGIGHKEFKDSELGLIPKSWEVQFLSNTKNVNDQYSFTGGPFGSNLKNCDFTKNGVRIIQLQNIGDGDFLNEYKIYTSSQKADELISCNIYPGDIIMSKMGDPVARATIIPDTETRYVMSSDGIRLSINEKKYDLKFILESINHHSTRNQAKVLSIGSTRQRIGLTDIRKLLIRIPQLDEQKKISLVINSIDLKIKKINQKLVKTKLLKKSLMQDLLTGKVRVPVN